MQSTEQKISNLLNSNELTVEALSQALGLSRNSVHLQVNKLEAAGIVEKFKASATEKSVGKPAWTYRLVAEQEDAFSSAHKTVLRGLIQTLSAKMPDKQRAQLMETAGRNIAKSAGLSPEGNLKKDIEKSVAVVNQLGATAQLSLRKKQFIVSCHSCPIASSVHVDGSMCGLVAAFFSEATGEHVNIECVRERTVVCGFSFGN